MIIYKAKDGIWVRSKYTGIAYEVEAMKIENNKIKEVFIENESDLYGIRKEWWKFNRFDLLTPIQINSELIITILHEVQEISEETIIKLR